MSGIDYKKNERTQEQKAKDMQELSKKMMGGLQDLQDRAEERSKSIVNWHKGAVNDQSYREKFFKKAVKTESWNVQKEAIAYCFCSDPEHWRAVAPMYGQRAKNLEQQAMAAIGVSLTAINPIGKEKGVRVKTEDFVKWLHSKELLPYRELAEAIGIKQAIDKPQEKPLYSDHKNAEHNAQKRQKVLEAALAILAAYPDQCVYRGRISGTAIYKVMIDKSNIWFGYDDLPYSEDSIVDLLNKAIKTLESDD